MSATDDGAPAGARQFTPESFDLEGIADALQSQDSFDMVQLVDPKTADLLLWTEDGGIDGENPVDLDDVDAVAIDPLPSYVWYQDMVDFAEGISDDAATRRLGRALRGRGAFRHFRDELYEEYPDLVSVWQEFRDVRARRRAVRWVSEEGLLSAAQEEAYGLAHPDPDLS